MAVLIELLVALLTLAGLVYTVLALWSARSFTRDLARRTIGAEFAPDVTILKPMKGVDQRLYQALASHCRQVYAGRFEIIFGVSTAEDPAVAECERLQREFPQVTMRVVVCPERLGTSGKVSNLVQMLRETRSEHVVINDSDILVSPQYLMRVMAPFANGRVGMVTAPYIGRAVPGAGGLTVWSRLEALGISTDFMPGVLTARMLEGGIRFGLGSTLAMTQTALGRAGGMDSLLEYLADDYEMGARIAAEGYRVELCGEVVETTVPAYTAAAFRDHQMRWARSTRDSRRLGYLGLGITYCVPWAVMTCVASGLAMWSFTLLSVVLLARVSLALAVGVGVLRDGQVLRDLWLLPLRDFCGLGFWLWSYASDTVIWRGERFTLRKGQLVRC